MRSVIDALLRELDAVVGDLHPRWREGWQPGLTRAEIDAALAPLDGWRPPDEILALYEWRNGQAGSEERCLWVPIGVLPLHDAVTAFLRMRQMFPTWPPLFAFGYGSKTHLEVPLARASCASAPLYLRDNEGSPFYAFTGLEGLLRAGLDAYREGLVRWRPEPRCWTTADDRALHAVRLRRNPGTSPTLWDEDHEQRGVLWISTFDPSAWPAEWQDFIGFDAAGFVPQGATATVADVALGRVDWSTPVIVEATIEGLMAFGDETRVHLTDGVHVIEVRCRGVLASGVAMGDRFEFELEHERPLTATEREARRRHDELLGAAVRDSLQGATASATAAELDALLFVDLMTTGLADPPAFIAKRVALVARRPADAEEPEIDPRLLDPAEAAPQPRIDAATQAVGDHLANGFIAGYWHKFVGTGTWSYHGWPPKYVPGDRWADRAQWIAAARRCIAEQTYVLSAYQILLAEGLTDCAADALAMIESWHADGGHDAYYFYDVLARLPDSELRREYLDITDPDALWDDEDEVRRALIAVDDARTCALSAERIVRALSAAELDEQFVEERIIPRLVELGPRCRTYVPEPIMARAKAFCLELLARDRAIATRRDRLDDDTRRRWIRDEIAHIAWRLGWFDVLRDLDREAWYWSTAFEFDHDNYTLLTWSLLVANDALKARAVEVMRTDRLHPLDGAIAWVRLHAPPVLDLRAAP